MTKLLEDLFLQDPFVRIRKGKNRGKYRSPSGRIFNRRQVARYYARGGTFDASQCRCRSTHEELTCDAARSARRDPSRTLDLRRAFIREIESRWRQVSRMLTEAISGQDLFGLGRVTPQTIAYTSGQGGQVQTFQHFADHVLSSIAVGQDQGQWMGKYVVASYLRAWERTAKRINREDLHPLRDRADLLQRLAVTEMQGVAEAVSQQIVRAFGDGLLAHRKPAEVARLVRARVASVGVVRARATAQFLTVRASSEATLDILQLAGHQRVGILPETLPSPGRRAPVRDFGNVISLDARRARRVPLFEILTAGDDDVCPVCEDLADEGPYTIAEARGLIPAHPNCRCAFEPYDSALDAASVADYDPSQPRGPDGKWETGGGGVTVYHGTTSRNVDSILKKGLRVSGVKRNYRAEFYKGDRKGAVFVTNKHSTAKGYAQTIGLDRNGDAAVLTVKVPKKEWASFKRDMEHSGKGAAYTTKNIPAKWIKKLDIFHARGGKHIWSERLRDAVPEMPEEPEDGTLYIVVLLTPDDEFQDVVQDGVAYILVDGSGRRGQRFALRERLALARDEASLEGEGKVVQVNLSEDSVVEQTEDEVTVEAGSTLEMLGRGRARIT